MRLPVLNADDKTKIDYEQLNHMVDAFLEAGFTYFDTAYPYHGDWSERAVKECLADRHNRESFLLADKLPAWSLKQRGDVECIFAEQLQLHELHLGMLGEHTVEGLGRIVAR